MADKMAAKWYFHHNLCISSADLITIFGRIVLIVVKAPNLLQSWTRYWKRSELVDVLHELRSGHFQAPFFFLNYSKLLFKKLYVSPEMSTKLFIIAFITLLSQNRGEYIMCGGGGGGGSHPFLLQINIKKYHTSSKKAQNVIKAINFAQSCTMVY